MPSLLKRLTYRALTAATLPRLRAAQALIGLCHHRFETTPGTDPIPGMAVTPDSAIPASWTNSGVDSTMAVEFVGTTVNILLDGVLVGHATSTRNSSAIGTGVGMVGEGNSRRLRSITVTV